MDKHNTIEYLDKLESMHYDNNVFKLALRDVIQRLFDIYEVSPETTNLTEVILKHGIDWWGPVDKIKLYDYIPAY